MIHMIGVFTEAMLCIGQDAVVVQVPHHAAANHVFH